MDTIKLHQKSQIDYKEKYKNLRVEVTKYLAEQLLFNKAHTVNQSCKRFGISPFMVNHYSKKLKT